jgi:hypothetical protein
MSHQVGNRRLTATRFRQPDTKTCDASHANAGFQSQLTDSRTERLLVCELPLSLSFPEVQPRAGVLKYSEWSGFYDLLPDDDV